MRVLRRNYSENYSTLQLNTKHTLNIKIIVYVTYVLNKKRLNFFVASQFFAFKFRLVVSIHFSNFLLMLFSDIQWRLECFKHFTQKLNEHRLNQRGLRFDLRRHSSSKQMHLKASTIDLQPETVYTVYYTVVKDKLIKKNYEISSNYESMCAKVIASILFFNNFPQLCTDSVLLKCNSKKYCIKISYF